ncbi:hypothetical protein SBOR_9472 [Sclerotinia borealis F-4128]|uniref:Uncharacterized protein n=1 Tax=Sclerotinia borealis (strain F-4128) TaxID=1432307 RepID=W9C6D1_SCLBF|nr:hypothetical protein SBOR_9472 [Sclerotinia borealis F-4128]
MSQFFSQESHHNVPQPPRSSTIVVPLVKFSCSLTHQGSTTGSHWTHYSRNDLELVIQRVQVGDPQGQQRSDLVMKVVAGAEYLEEQNLEDIARIFKNFISSPGIEIPVRVVVKPPLLALRYPKFHDVRRLQFRFRDDSGFNQIVSVLTNLGLAATDSAPSGPAMQPRPSTVNSTSSGISMISSTPTTSYLSSSQNTEFKVPMRPDSASSIPQRSSSSYASRSENHLLNRPQSAMSISSFMPQSKSYVEALKRAQSVYASQLEKEPREIQSSNWVVPSPNDIPLSHDTYMNRVLLSKPEESQPRFSSSPFFETHTKDCLPNGLTSSCSDNGTDYSIYNGHGTTTMPRNLSSFEYYPLPRLTEYSTFSALGTRPVSLPTEHDSCSNPPIPPKRQLPFATVKCPLESVSIAEDTNLLVQALDQRKRPLKEFLDANPPKEISTPAKKPTGRRVASRKGTLHLPAINDFSTRAVPPIIRSSGDGLDVPIQTEEPSSLVTKSVIAPRASLPSKLQSIEVTARQRPVATLPDKPMIPKMVDRSTQTQTLSGRDHTAALKLGQSTSVAEALSNLPTAFEPPPILQNDLDLFVSRYSPRSRVSLPPSYSDMPDDVRHKMLNDFIIENLENEDFLKLAEDMDASWRRMGLTR